MNILCFLEKGCRWGLTFHGWVSSRPPRLVRGGHPLRERDALREKNKNKELFKIYN